VFVGDASMNPYEITHRGGAVDFWNEEPGAVWLQRMTAHYRSVAWLNPQPQAHWRHTHSVSMIGELMAGRMFPMTLRGLDEMIAELRK
jgi:uncharacterized protein with von Willebrand factor type A (vWA) domain